MQATKKLHILGSLRMQCEAHRTHVLYPMKHTQYILRCVAILVRLWVAVAYRTNIHPLCKLPSATNRNHVHIEDITTLLHGKTVPPNVCIFNPTVVHLQDDLYLWAARTYTTHDELISCVESFTVHRPLLTDDRWLGYNTIVFAVTQLSWRSGALSLNLVGHLRLNVSLEDPRLFKDADGATWVLNHAPKGGLMVVARVNTTCLRNTTAGSVSCEISMGSMRILWFLNMMRVEKNWVPHNGTTRMSYPVYPTFAPHSVFQWHNYDEPPILRDFDSVAPMESFFVDFNNTYGHHIQFSGSTPAVLEDDGLSYVAVGHVRTHGQCFHLLNGTIAATCAELLFSKRKFGPTFFSFEHDGISHRHHYKEYGMFIYRFSATPPYRITHISHSFQPCSVSHHTGIVYPAGLERVGTQRDFLISYGDTNRYSRLLIMPAATFYGLLIPIERMNGSDGHYALCTLPCGR